MPMSVVRIFWWGGRGRGGREGGREEGKEV